MRKKLTTAVVSAGIIGAGVAVPANASTTYTVPASQEQPPQAPATQQTPVATVLPMATKTETISHVSPVPVTNNTVQHILDRHNAHRAAHGLAPLTYDPALSQVSQNWSMQMGAMQSMVHNPNIVSQAPAGWSRVAENIAYNSWSGAQGADMLVDQWIASPVHNSQMLGDFNTIGIGVYEANGYTWGVVNFGTY